MSEGEVVEQLIGYMSLLLLGVSIIFPVAYTYIVALNYFVGEAQLMARVGAFGFVTLILVLLLVVMVGAEGTHAGLILRLEEIRAEGHLTAAGAGALANAQNGIDGVVRAMLWLGMVTVFAALFYMTFVHRWKPDIVNVQIQSRKNA